MNRLKYLIRIEIIPGNITEKIEGIEVKVLTKKYASFLWWEFKQKEEITNKYFIPGKEEIALSWNRTLPKEKTFLEFNNKLDFDFFIADNNLSNYETQNIEIKRN